MRFWWIAVGTLLAGCASMEQTESEVYQRVSGGRLQKWLSLPQAAARHWPYAWASVAAYQDADDPKRQPLQTTSECPSPDRLLPAQGWTLWDELPLLRQTDAPGSAGEQLRRVHLRAEVWANAREHKVVVAFGGTAGTSLDDWQANLRWLLAPLHLRDQFVVLSDTFLPAFVEAYRQRSAAPGGGWLKSAQVVSTGHSLGAGLAQRFAYALNAGSGVPRVREVYAFDPSPVSGKRGVEGWEAAADGLTIYRVYNRGEILASLRSILAFVEDPPQAQGQRWIDIRYKSQWSWRTLLPDGWVHAHGLFDLACVMKQAAQLPSPP